MSGFWTVYLFHVQWHRLSFLALKRPEHGVNHPPSSSVEVKEIVEPYFCSPFLLSWSVVTWNLSFISFIYGKHHHWTNALGVESCQMFSAHDWFSNSRSRKHFYTGAGEKIWFLWMRQFIGAFVKLQKATISFVICLASVFVYAWGKSAPTGRILTQFDIWPTFENLSRKFNFH